MNTSCGSPSLFGCPTQTSDASSNHGYAVGFDSLYAAMAAEERRRQEAAEIDRILAWASLGFGLLTMVPVVGQAALAAAIAITR